MLCVDLLCSRATHSCLLTLQFDRIVGTLQANATMFMAILTAFKALLVRYSQEDDLIVGVPYSGRNRAETEGLIGAFLGAVALRSDLSDGPSFNTLLARVRKVRACL